MGSAWLEESCVPGTTLSSGTARLLEKRLPDGRAPGPHAPPLLLLTPRSLRAPQVFIMADSTSRGSIELEELKNLHHVLGEPLTESEAASAFKAPPTQPTSTRDASSFAEPYSTATPHPHRHGRRHLRRGAGTSGSRG